LIITTKAAFGVVRIQTDDTLILGSKKFDTIKDKKLTRAKFSAKPKELLSPDTPLIFNGCILTQKEADIELRQKKQGRKLKTVNPTAKDPQHEYREQRACEAYIATICQPKAAFDLSVAAQHQNLTEANITALNKRIEWQMTHMDRGIKYIVIDLTTAKLFVFVDRLFANNKDFSS
jgi:hypothetical protein